MSQFWSKPTLSLSIVHNSVSLEKFANRQRVSEENIGPR